MPVTPGTPENDRYQVLLQVFQFIAAWAADEAAHAADCTVRSPEGATARLATARAMCAHWAERLAERLKRWEYEDFRGADWSE